jgi:hypothetical protein
MLSLRSCKGEKDIPTGRSSAAVRFVLLLDSDRLSRNDGVRQVRQNRHGKNRAIVGGLAAGDRNRGQA